VAGSYSVGMAASTLIDYLIDFELIVFKNTQEQAFITSLVRKSSLPLLVVQGNIGYKRNLCFP
jgi:hypothetical protein